MAGRFMLNKRRSGIPLMPFAQTRDDFLAEGTPSYMRRP